jgi:hypothetical protein
MPQLETDPEHAAKVAEFLRTLSNAELLQGTANPRAFAGRLRGITTFFPGQQSEKLIVELIRGELQRRRDVETERRFRATDQKAIASVAISGLALAVSFAAFLASILK